MSSINDEVVGFNSINLIKEKMDLETELFGKKIVYINLLGIEDRESGEKLAKITEEIRKLGFENLIYDNNHLLLYRKKDFKDKPNVEITYHREYGWYICKIEGTDNANNDFKIKHIFPIQLRTNRAKKTKNDKNEEICF